MNFSHRSYDKELLDRDDIPFADIRQNMRELDIINSRLGGHAITIEGFRKLLQNKTTVTIAEIGCGGGDNLLAIVRWCRKRNITVKPIGIDINPDCIRVAKSALAGTDAVLLASDYCLVDFGDEKPDIIFSSLFCHHFTEKDLVTMLQWMDTHSNLGFFINDLHRHPLAYYSIKWITTLFSNSYLVKNDAPLSVRRGFARGEWLDLLQQAGISHATTRWRWAFRWLVICVHPLPVGGKPVMLSTVNRQLSS
ncbi:MAG TPA: methyltransferase domain-containing protein [Chitinophagaceae bacterium]